MGKHFWPAVEGGRYRSHMWQMQMYSISRNLSHCILKPFTTPGQILGYHPEICVNGGKISMLHSFCMYYVFIWYVCIILFIYLILAHPPCKQVQGRLQGPRGTENITIRDKLDTHFTQMTFENIFSRFCLLSMLPCGLMSYHQGARWKFDTCCLSQKPK